MLVLDAPEGRLGDPGGAVRGGGREGGDAQPGGGHRDQGDLLDPRGGAGRARLERGDDVLVVRDPLGDAAGTGGEPDGHGVVGERVVRDPGAGTAEDGRGAGHEAVVPRRGRVDLVLGEGVVARVPDVALSDLQGVRQRPPVDTDRAVVARPGAQGGPLRQAQGDAVAVGPGALDADEGRAVGRGHGPAVDPHPRPLAPARYPQAQREGDAARGGNGEGDRVVEGVVGVLGDGHPGAVGADGGRDPGRGVHRGGQAPVGRAEPQFLGEVGPAHAVVVRAAAVVVDAGLVRLHGEAVLELSLRLAGVVQVDAVGAGHVVDGTALGVEGGGQRVEGQILAAVGPDRVAGDPDQQFVGGHELDDAAGLETLPRVAEPGPDVLVPGQPAPGELPVPAHDLLVRVIGGPGVGGGAGELGVLGGFAEALGDVDVVRAGQRAGPVGAPGVHLLDEVEQEGVAGAAVQPQREVDAVAPAQRDPAGVEGALALGVHEPQEPGEQGQDPRVARVLLPGAQCLEQGQERPEVGAAVE